MTATGRPGELIGTGRSADIYDLGNGRVLRRFRTEYNSQPEAELMGYLAKAGFPVPAVYDANGPDLVMERLDGPDVLADFASRPWLAGQHGRLIADLHNQLHQIEAPPWLRRAFLPGDRVLHMDLHPGNVMMTSRGPVVIDWTGAAAGPPAADVAMVYVILTSSDIDLIPLLLRPFVPPLRALHLKQFLATAQHDPWPVMAQTAKFRMRDPNVRPAEVTKLQRIVDRAAARTVGDAASAG